MELVHQRKAERALMLKQLYELAEGRLNKVVKIIDAGSTMGLTTDESRNVMGDLGQRGFLKIVDRGGKVSLTCKGSQFVEDLAEKEIQEFGETYSIALVGSSVGCGTANQEVSVGANSSSRADQFWNWINRSASIATFISLAFCN